MIRSRVTAVLALMVVLSLMPVNAAISIIGGTVASTTSGGGVTGNLHQFDYRQNLFNHELEGILQVTATVGQGSIGSARASFSGGSGKTVTGNLYNYQLNSYVSGNVLAEAKKSSIAGTATSTARITSEPSAYNLGLPPIPGGQWGTVGGIDGDAEIMSFVFLDGVGSVASTASGSASYDARTGFLDLVTGLPLARNNVISGSVNGVTSLSGSNNLLGGYIQGTESMTSYADSPMDTFRAWSSNTLYSDLQSGRGQLGNTLIAGSIKGTSTDSTAKVESYVNKNYLLGPYNPDRNSRLDTKSEAAINGAVKTYKRDDFGHSYAELTTQSSTPDGVQATNYLDANAQVERSNYQTNPNSAVANVNIASATWSGNAENHAAALGDYDSKSIISGDVGILGFGANVAARNPTYNVGNFPQQTAAEVRATQSSDQLGAFTGFSTFDMWLNGPRQTGSALDFASANSQVLNQNIAYIYQSTFFPATTSQISIDEQRAVHSIAGNTNLFTTMLPGSDSFTWPDFTGTWGTTNYNAPLIIVDPFARTAWEGTDTTAVW